MKVKIKVTYTIESKNALDLAIDEKLDKRITDIFDHIGAKWYAQGVDTNSGVRDICFDLVLK